LPTSAAIFVDDASHRLQLKARIDYEQTTIFYNGTTHGPNKQDFEKTAVSLSVTVFISCSDHTLRKKWKIFSDFWNAIPDDLCSMTKSIFNYC
jgi:G:T/U-mismatch repair DNA glycosylase